MSDIVINHKRGRAAANVAKFANPATATTEQIATKINELIQALIDSKQMKEA